MINKIYHNRYASLRLEDLVFLVTKLEIPNWNLQVWSAGLCQKEILCQPRIDLRIIRLGISLAVGKVSRRCCQGLVQEWPASNKHFDKARSTCCRYKGWSCGQFCCSGPGLGLFRVTSWLGKAGFGGCENGRVGKLNAGTDSHNWWSRLVTWCLITRRRFGGGCNYHANSRGRFLITTCRIDRKGRG